MEELAAAYGRREISYTEWMAARKPIQNRLDTARQSLRTDTRLRTLHGFANKGGHDLRRLWSHLNLTRQRAIISAVLDHAIVNPPRVRGQNRFDRERITPIWRL
jgi:site-specific DNA recombinase